MLYVDIGNTRIHGKRGDEVFACSHSDFGSRLHDFVSNVDDVLFSSVSREKIEFYSSIFRKFGFNVYELSFDDSFARPYPTFGDDRMINILGASRVCESPFAVCDFGTATHVEAMIGTTIVAGPIIPGLRAWRSCVASDIPSLAPFAAGGELSIPCQNSESCIDSGVIFGTCGAIEKFVRQFEAYFCTKFKLVLTGGNAEAVKSHLDLPYMERSTLTLEGLEEAYFRGFYRPLS